MLLAVLYVAFEICNTSVSAHTGAKIVHHSRKGVPWAATQRVDIDGEEKMAPLGPGCEQCYEIGAEVLMHSSFEEFVADLQASEPLQGRVGNIRERMKQKTKLFQTSRACMCPNVLASWRGWTEPASQTPFWSCAKTWTRSDDQNK